MKGFRSTLLVLIIVAGSLLLMLGQFWLLYVAPLLIFLGIAVAYGYLSSRPVNTGRSPSHALPPDSEK